MVSYKKDRKVIMTNTKDVIAKLKEVKKEKGLSLDKILVMVENNGEYISKSTLARVFKDGSENCSFRYEETIRPIANALLDIENYEATDDPETLAFKSLLQLKMRVIDENSRMISELQEQIKDTATEEKLKYQKKLQQEVDKFQRSLDFLKNQVELKDKRIDQLMDANDRLSITNDRLINQLMDCPLRSDKECDK